MIMLFLPVLHHRGIIIQKTDARQAVHVCTTRQKKGDKKGMDRETELKAGEIMKQYRVHKWVSTIMLALDIVFLIYMVVFKMDYRIDYIVGGFASFMLIVSLFVTYAAVAAAAVFVKWLGAVKIDMALYEQCDPFVYEVCLNGLHTLFYKDRIACLHAMAQYYQGNIDKAEEILRGVNLYKLKGMFRLNYYIIMCAICFHKGRGMQAAELERSFRNSLKNNKKNQMCFEVLCASNNLIRAMENKDYSSAFKFLSERKQLDGPKCRKWTLIGYSLYEAEIYAGIGDEKSARLNLDYVISEGGRLVFVEHARELLRDMEKRADGEAQNG